MNPEPNPQGPSTLASTAACPCGSTETFGACCLPRIDGSKPAETAEALMRSRYTAFALAKIEYLDDTHDGEKTDEEREVVRSWAKSVSWLGLKIVSTEQGGTGDDTGKVEFVATYIEGSAVIELKERSDFRRKAGKWMYADGVAEIVRARIGRNDKCPCNSGKKFKACHG